jgi:hypothetical protein
MVIFTHASLLPVPFPLHGLCQQLRSATYKLQVLENYEESSFMGRKTWCPKVGAGPTYPFK